MSLVMSDRPTVSELAESPRPSVPTWLLAALVAVLLHASAGVLAYTHLQSDDDDPAFGAQAIEIGLDMSAPHTEQTDLPPGPEADDSAASTAQVQQEAKVEESTLPKDTPTETPDPDRVVAPDAAKKPKDDDPKVKAQPTNASAESVASEAAAPPPSETAVEAPRSVAPAIGTGDSARRIKATWQRELVAHLDHHKRYPTGAPARTAQILVSFTIDRTGHVLKSEVVKSSGDAAFDQAALAMMHRSDPVPPPPALVADDGLTFTVPVVFRLKGGHG
jgi:protein TonB